MRLSFRILALVGGLALAACGAEPRVVEPEEETTTTSITTTTTMATTPTPETPMQEEDTVQAAINDLASRLRLGAEDIELIDFREVQWPDGSIGCPEEGMFYTQAIVEGSQVLLEADGRIYDYHAGADGVPFLCESEEDDGGYDFVPPPGFHG